MTLINRSTVAQTGSLDGHALIVDTCPLKLVKPPESIVLESAGQKRKVTRLHGQFQKADSPNQNGRIYEYSTLKHAVESIQEDIKARKVMGEFDHPQDAKIHLDRVSHLITKLWMEGKTVYGELEILSETTYGKQLLALINAGVTVGISSRGVGDMETIMKEGNEYQRVMPGYSFVTFDAVGEPSVHNSYLSVMESKQNKAKLQKINERKKTEARILREMQNYLFKK